MLKSINPATGRTVKSYEIYSEKGVEKIISDLLAYEVVSNSCVEV